jgi:hypothetical protein
VKVMRIRVIFENDFARKGGTVRRKGLYNQFLTIPTNAMFVK